ncbi:MAG: hypothetical protein L0Y74_02255, partial [candidate division Zixibacteria bacterium]|nr:hypothetical protein [candidate division Zixibacteria bacterium]
EKLVGIYLDGKKVAQTEIAIPPQSQTQVEFTYSVGNTGFHSGYIELGEDNLLSDNYRYFGFKIPEEIKILVAGESAGDNLPLQLALKPEEKLNLNLTVKSIPESGLANADFDSYQVVILNNLNSLAPITVTRLGHYLETGGGAWIILGPDSDLDSYSQNLTVNWFGLTLSKESKAVDVGAHHFLENWDFNHPVFSIYKEIPKDSLPKVQFNRIVPAQTKSGSGILAGFSGNLPALIETRVETGKALLFLSDLKSSSSDLPLHPFFVPLVNRIVGYLASDLETQNRAFSTGDVIQLQLEQLPAGKPIQLIHPDQTKEALTPILTGNSALVKIDKSFLPGAYRIESEGKLLEQAIFNIDTQEKDLGDISLNQIREQLKSSGNQINLVEVPASAGLAEFVQRTRYGRELWREVLVLALLLLGAEMWLGRTASRTESEESAAKASV